MYWLSDMQLTQMNEITNEIEKNVNHKVEEKDELIKTVNDTENVKDNDNKKSDTAEDLTIKSKEEPVKITSVVKG